MLNELQKTIPRTIRNIKEGGRTNANQISIEYQKQIRWLQSNNEKVHYIRRATDAAAFTTTAAAVHFFFFLSFLTDPKKRSDLRELKKKKTRRTENKNETQLPTNCFALYEVQ